MTEVLHVWRTSCTSIIMATTLNSQTTVAATVWLKLSHREDEENFKANPCGIIVNHKQKSWKPYFCCPATTKAKRKSVINRTYIVQHLFLDRSLVFYSKKHQIKLYIFKLFFPQHDFGLYIQLSLIHHS